MLSSLWTNRFLVLLLIALPTIPIFWDVFYPSSYSKWLLANAANQYDKGEVEQAQRLLRRSYDLWPEIARDANFWQQLGRIELSPESPVSNDSTWLSIVRKIPEPEQQANAAAEVASLMLERKMHPNALAVLKEFFPAPERRSPRQNNLIAYTRALAKQDLDEALQEIDLALRRLENESFLDTKAWILHQMERNDEALEVIDRSIEMHMETLRNISAFAPVLESMEEMLHEREKNESTTGAPSSSESQKTNEENAVGWAHQKLREKFTWSTRLDVEYQIMATLRYHRLRILEALHLTNRAEEDSRWLEAFAPKPWDSLD
jgi:tetratricopeptide (TPR) repeat protein